SSRVTSRAWAMLPLRCSAAQTAAFTGVRSDCRGPEQIDPWSLMQSSSERARLGAANDKAPGRADSPGSSRHAARMRPNVSGGRPTAVPAPAGGGAPSAGSARLTYRVARRQVEFIDPSRVTDPNPGQPGKKTQGRKLPTTIWYPAPLARGPFSMVLFSHGLLG